MTTNETTTPIGADITIQDFDSVVKIIDTGEGMSAEFIETRLFKPFDTTKGNAGMGIGAYDAKNYIEEMDGIITVESEIDQGTVFTLSIPVTD